MMKKNTKNTIIEFNNNFNFLVALYTGRERLYNSGYGWVTTITPSSYFRFSFMFTDCSDVLSRFSRLFRHYLRCYKEGKP